MISARRIARCSSSRLFAALIVLACLACDAAIAIADGPGESVGLQSMYTYRSCSSTSPTDPINVVFEGGEPLPRKVGRVLSHHGWNHNDYSSPVLKLAQKLHLGGPDYQWVQTTTGQCRRDDDQQATGGPIGNRNHVRLFSTVAGGKLWVVGDAHHDQVVSHLCADANGVWYPCNNCDQALIGGHISSSFNSGREALKGAWPSTSRFVTWGNTAEITQCNGEKKHSDGKVLYLNSNIAGIAGYDPENTEEPAISGDPQVGSTLTAQPGTWTGNPTSFVYEWCHVEPSEDLCTPYSGATGSTWTPTSSSVGSFVGVMVRPFGADEADRVLTDLVQVSSSLPTPTVTSLAPSNVSPLGATLNGWVNPNGLDTHYYFQWGPTTSYGNTIPASPGMDLGSGSEGVLTANEIGGLKAKTTYHYRVVASSSGGTSYGADQTFVTPAPPPVLGMISSSGTAYMKEAPFGVNSWSAIADGVSQLVIAEGRIGIVKDNGTAEVLEYPYGATAWKTVASGVTQMAMAGERIGIVTSNGTAQFEEGPVSSTGWKPIASNVTEIVMSGNRVGIVQGVGQGGLASYQEAPFSAIGWKSLANNVTEMVMSGNRIGIVQASQAGLASYEEAPFSSSGWKTLANNVTEMSMAGNYIGIVQGLAQARLASFQEAPFSSSGWLAIGNNVTQMMMSPESTGVVIGNNAYFQEAPFSSSEWTLVQANNATQLSMTGANQQTVDALTSARRVTRLTPTTNNLYFENAPFSSSGWSILAENVAQATMANQRIARISSGNLYYENYPFSSSGWQILAENTKQVALSRQQIARISTSGYLYYENYPFSSSGWGLLAENATQVSLANERIAMVNNGNLFYENYPYSASGWSIILEGVSEASMTNERILALRKDGKLYYEDWPFSASGWQLLAEGVSQAAIAGDRIAMVNNGKLYYESWPFSASGWQVVAENVSQASLAGERITMVTNGKLYYEDWPFSASGWQILAENVSRGSLEG